MKRDDWYYRLLLLCLVVLLSGGCAPGKISHILINDMPVSGETQTAVMLMREGESTAAKVATELKKGDEIRTLPGVTAIVWLQGDSQLILAPETHIQLVNVNHIIKLFKSTGEAIGQVFVKAKDSLRIDAGYAAANTEGTEFQVRSGPGDTVTVSVISGVVRMEAGAGQFAPLRLSRLEQVSLTPGVAPRKTALTSEQANRIIDWVNQVEQKAGKKEISRLVPDVTGLPLEAAQNKLKAANVIVGKLVGSIEGKQPIGRVIAQNPQAGGRINKNQGVTLIYRAEERGVPQLVGLEQHVAMQRIGGLRLVPGEVKTAITGTAVPGRVIEQNPPPLQRVAVESVVDIVVEAESVMVPALTGRMLHDAKYALQNARLELGQVKEQMTGRFEPGTVTSQTPQQMTRVAPYTSVAVTVEAESVVVPELRNYQVDRAHELLGRAGLKVGSQQRQLVANAAAGNVIGQNPPPGERVRKFSPVSLTVAEAGVEVPSLTGVSYRRATVILKGVGLSTSNPTRHPRADMAADTVISQSPRAGTLVRQGTHVHLDISQKPVAVVPVPPIIRPPLLQMQAACRVPDIMHKTENVAVSMIRKAGLVPRIEFRLGGEQVVTQQAPQGNTTAVCGSTVTYSIGRLQ